MTLKKKIGLMCSYQKANNSNDSTCFQVQFIERAKSLFKTGLASIAKLKYSLH